MKNLIILLFVVTITLGMFTVSLAAIEPEYVWTWNTGAVPTAAHAQGGEVFAKELERLTDGKVIVKTYYAGSLFPAEAQVTAVSRGVLDFCGDIDPNVLIADQVPSLGMLASAYLWKDSQHMTSVLNGEIGKEISDIVAEKTNIRLLSAAYMGTRQLGVRDIGRVIKTPADMKGVKLRMPNSQSWLFMGEALGGNPTPLSNSENYMALKTGTIDAQDNPLPNVIARKFYEVTKYIIMTGHYISPNMLGINEKLWQSLTPELQDNIMAAADKAREFVDNLIKEQEAEAVAFLKGKGMEFIEVDRDLWREHVKNYYLANKISSQWDMDLYNRIESAAK